MYGLQNYAFFCKYAMVEVKNALIECIFLDVLHSMSANGCLNVAQKGQWQPHAILSLSTRWGCSNRGSK